MRRKITFGLCLAAALGLSATGFMLNQRSGAQDTPKKNEPEAKKDDLFDFLKSALESKTQAPQSVPVPPPSVPPATSAPKEPVFPPLPTTPSAPLIPPPTVTQAKDDKPVTPPILPPVTDTPKIDAPAPVTPPKEVEKPMPATITFPPPETKPPMVVTPPQPMVDVKPAVPTTPASPQAAPPLQPMVDVKPTVPTTPASTQAVPPLQPKDTSVKPVADSGEPLPSTPPLAPVKPHLDLPPVRSNQPTKSVELEVVEAVVKRNSPWTMHVEMIDGQTVVTATVNKKHEFKIACQTLDLHTGKRELKASGKVQISGDMMHGSCDHLAISLGDDRLVLEGSAEVRIQKVTTNVSDTKPASFELKGQTLNLRISELQSGKYLQTGLRQASDVGPAYLPTLPGKAVSVQSGVRQASDTSGGKQWTPYGMLRRVESKVYLAGEGEMVWALHDARGNTIAQILARDGGTLTHYEGQRISVLGMPEQIKGGTYLRVTHIALP